MKNFDMDFYVKRNEETARRLYGKQLDENRRVKGTSIWFDSFLESAYKLVFIFLSESIEGGLNFSEAGENVAMS